MSFFDAISRALGGLRPLSDEELAAEHEELRLRYCASGDDLAKADRLHEEMDRYNAEMTRRANEAYNRENPEPRPTRHREHGWYLDNDD